MNNRIFNEIWIRSFIDIVFHLKTPRLLQIFLAGFLYFVLSDYTSVFLTQINRRRISNVYIKIIPFWYDCRKKEIFQKIMSDLKNWNIVPLITSCRISSEPFYHLINIYYQKQECSVRKCVLRNFAKFIEKHLCQSAGLRPATLLKKRLWNRCFPVNFAKFLRTLFLQNTLRRLLLYCFHTFIHLLLRKVKVWYWSSVLSIFSF